MKPQLGCEFWYNLEKPRYHVSEGGKTSNAGEFPQGSSAA